MGATCNALINAYPRLVSASWHSPLAQPFYVMAFTDYVEFTDSVNYLRLMITQFLNRLRTTLERLPAS